MIIGNGLIANAFKKIDSDELLIFASGVSNSMEDNESEYLRELALIEKYSNTDKKFIYFSTININDSNRRYFQHKRNVENLICNFNNYLIFRLPNIIGDGGNSNNIFNFFIEHLLNNKTIYTENISRSLVDIEDIVKICSYSFKLSNSIIDIALIEMVTITDIVNIIGESLNIVPIIEKIETTKNNISLKNSEIVDEAILYLNILAQGYTEKIIKKYIANGKYKR